MKKGSHNRAVELVSSSREYPERLGTGRPANPDYRVQDYLELLIYEKMGAADKAAEARARINAHSARFWADSVESIKSKVDQGY